MQRLQIGIGSGLAALGLALGLVFTVGTSDAAEQPTTVTSRATTPIVELAQPGVVIAGQTTEIAVPQPGIRVPDQPRATVAVARTPEQWTALGFAAAYDACAAAALSEAMASHT